MLIELRASCTIGGFCSGLRVGVLAALGVVAIAPGQLSASSPSVQGSFVASDARQKRVLALYPTQESQPNLAAFDAEYVRALNEALEGRLDYYHEYMDVGRVHATDEYLATFRTFLRRKYEHRPPDLVIAYSYYVVEFVERFRSELFPNTPIVFFSPPDRPVAGTVVTTNGDWSDSLRFALQLQPRTKHVFVIGGASDYDRYNSDFVRTLFRVFEGRVTLTYLIGRPLPELQQQVASLPPDSLIYFVLMMQDGAGRRFDGWTGLDKIVSTANAPIFTGFEPLLGHGVVGGRVWTNSRVAQPMVDVSVRLLRGEPPERIPTTVVDPYTYQVDWRQLKRWGIDERLLPAGTRILFRPPTVWELYRWYIIGAIALVGLQTLMIVSLVVQRASRRETEARNVAIVQAVPDMMLLLTREGVFVDFHSPDGGRPPRKAEFVGRHVRDVLPSELAGVLESSITRLAAGQPSEIVEFSTQTPEGEWQYEARVVPVQSSRVLAVVRDITERRRAEAALHEAQVRLRRASRLSALGQFAATIGHELRQPLTAILINARSCLRGIGAPTPDLEDVKAALLDVVESSQRAEAVIQRNQRLFRDQTVQAVRLDINSVIQESVALTTRRLVDNDVTLTLTLSEDLPSILGDRIELQQVLLNLIANALDAMESVEAASRRLQIASSLADDRRVSVTVTDNGVGLGHVDVNRLFTLSYTTKATGTGVGLSISRSIIEAHGGRLWAEQHGERGATFCFAIPACADVTGAQSDPVSPDHHDQNSSLAAN